MPATRKMVLLAMCDWANDEGTSCHPSIRALATRASISERQAKRVVHSLIEEGWICITGNEFGGAPGQTRQYRINVQAIETGDTGVTGDNMSRVTNDVPGRVTSATRRVTSATDTGDMGVTQTTIDPPLKASTSKASTTTREDVASIELPEWIDREHWTQWLSYRKSIKKPVNSAYAAGLLIKALEKLRANGHDAGDVIDNAIASGWQGLYAPKRDALRPSGGNAGNRQQQLEDRNQRAADEWLAKNFPNEQRPT